MRKEIGHWGIRNFSCFIQLNKQIPFMFFFQFLPFLIPIWINDSCYAVCAEVTKLCYSRIRYSFLFVLLWIWFENREMPTFCWVSVDHHFICKSKDKNFYIRLHFNFAFIKSKSFPVCSWTIMISSRFVLFLARSEKTKHTFEKNQKKGYNIFSHLRGMEWNA